MLLILTSTEDATANYLCSRLETDDVPYVRLDTDTFAKVGFVEYGQAGVSLVASNESYDPGAFSAVWYRRPRGISIKGPFRTAEVLHTSREWGASVDGFLAHIEPRRWVNHPAANVRAGNKLLQLSFAQRIGLLVPETLVTRSRDEALMFLRKHGGRVVAKPLSSGYVETSDRAVEAQIFTSRIVEEHLGDAHLLARTPTMLQQEIERGVDVRVTIVDRHVAAVGLVTQESGTWVDVRRLDPRRVAYTPVDIPVDVADRLFRIMGEFDIRFGAIDVIVDRDGRWVFLEINPNGQWAWMDILGNSDIASAFVKSFRSASMTCPAFA
jgi:glutathione synthase/RimK-type ligase-like ATP-grasp enzyme